MVAPALLGLAVISALAIQGWLFWHHRARELAVVGALALAVAALKVASWYDDTWDAWLREDAWVEWSTVYAFLAASALFAWRARSGGGLGRLTCAGLALFCFFVAGEELSWGQRLLAFEPPEIFLAENYQQEANLHNLLNKKEIAGFALDSRFLIVVIAVLYGLIAPTMAAALRWRFGDRAWTRDVAPTALLAPSFALIAAVELDYPIDHVGEAAEWMLGLTFLADAVLRRPPPEGRWGRGVLLLLPLSVLLGAVTTPVLEVVLYGSDEVRSAQAQAELDQLAADLDEAMQEKRLGRKSRVHKRVFTAVVSRYLRFGADSSFLEAQRTPAEVDDVSARRDRKGYFLDPWKNPYWILWDDDGETVVVYSFGANRRRDSDTDPFRRLEGDDLVGIVRLR